MAAPQQFVMEGAVRVNREQQYRLGKVQNCTRKPRATIPPGQSAKLHEQFSSFSLAWLHPASLAPSSSVIGYLGLRTCTVRTANYNGKSGRLVFSVRGSTRRDVRYVQKQEIGIFPLVVPVPRGVSSSFSTFAKQPNHEIVHLPLRCPPRPRRQRRVSF